MSLTQSIQPYISSFTDWIANLREWQLIRPRYETEIYVDCRILGSNKVMAVDEKSK